MRQVAERWPQCVTRHTHTTMINLYYLTLPVLEVQILAAFSSLQGLVGDDPLQQQLHTLQTLLLTGQMQGCVPIAVLQRCVHSSQD